jgi:hypothetical protein
MEITHTNKLYLPNKWCRLRDGKMLINPAFFEQDNFKALTDLDSRNLLLIWGSHDEEGAITEGLPGVDSVGLLKLGFLSTIKGL